MTITLATLDHATQQDIFDQVAEHLINQNRKSINDVTKKCVYRHGDLKCAAGCLIGDDEYNPEMDNVDQKHGTSWGSLIKRELVQSTAHDNFIFKLQSLHDGFDISVELSWERRLRRFADQHNLMFRGERP